MTSQTTDRTDAPATGGSGVGLELYVGLIWLATSAFVAHSTLSGGDLGLSGALDEAAGALPGIVGATIVTSAAIAAAVGGRFRGVGRRVLVGLAGGAGFGLVAAAAFRFGYGSYPQITTFALVVCAASVLGGAVTALPDHVIDAVLWATTWVFFLGVIFGVLAPSLVSVFTGASPTDAAEQAAAGKLAYGQSVLTGVLAVVYLSQKLGRGERVSRAWWPVAGALPGVVLLLSEGLTRLGGSALAGVAPSSLTLLGDTARLRHALIVLAVGALVATVVGLRRRPEED